MKGFLVIITLLIIILGGFYLLRTKNTNPGATPLPAPNVDSLPGIQASTKLPWESETGHLRERLTQISLPALSQEGTALHIHQHLDIFVSGQSVIIPADIGVKLIFISPIHTHDSTGIIHVESPKVQPFYLGQFFDIWGVKFTSECLGGYCNQENKKVQIYINGQPYNGDPRLLELKSHQEIVVTYGTIQELPKQIPSNYNFRPGL